MHRKDREPDVDRRVVFLDRIIDEELITEALTHILYMEHLDNAAPITLHINSPGGLVDQGMALIDTMSAIKTPIYTHVVGQASGMALAILAHGAKGHRTCVPDARLQITGLIAESESDDEDREVESLQRLLAHIVAKDTGQSANRVSLDMARERRLTPEEALAYGIVDEVVLAALWTPGHHGSANDSASAISAEYVSAPGRLEAFLERVVDVGLDIGRCVLTCFALIIAIAGLRGIGAKIDEAERCDDARDWHETSAIMQSVDLSTRTWKRARGGDGKQSKLTCAYEYNFAGHMYTSTTITLQKSFLDSWPDVTYPRLARAFNGKRPIPCFVNPVDPTDATLKREFSYALLSYDFTLCSCGVFMGVFLATGMITDYWRRRVKRGLRKLYPKEPWCWDREWLDRRLFVRWGFRHVALTLGGVVLIAITVSYLVCIPSLYGEFGFDPIGFAIVAVIVLISGVMLTFEGVRDWFFKRPFRGSYLELTDLPVRLGESLTATLMLSGRDDPPHDLEVTLECVRSSWYSGVGADPGWWEKRVLFTHVERVDRDYTLQDCGWARYELTIPLSPGHPSSNESDKLAVKWRLTIELPGRWFRRRLWFHVPVFGS